MRVLFKVNLGSMDAEKAGVDFKQCTAGAAIDCNDAAGKWLVANGIATEVNVPKPPEPPRPVVIPEPEVKPEPVVEVPVEPDDDRPEPKHNKHKHKN